MVNNILKIDRTKYSSKKLKTIDTEEQLLLQKAVEEALDNPTKTYSLSSKKMNKKVDDLSKIVGKIKEDTSAIRKAIDKEFKDLNDKIEGMSGGSLGLGDLAKGAGGAAGAGSLLKGLMGAGEGAGIGATLKSGGKLLGRAIGPAMLAWFTYDLYQRTKSKEAMDANLKNVQSKWWNKPHEGLLQKWFGSNDKPTNAKHYIPPDIKKMLGRKPTKLIDQIKKQSAETLQKAPSSQGSLPRTSGLEMTPSELAMSMFPDRLSGKNVSYGSYGTQYNKMGVTMGGDGGYEYYKGVPNTTGGGRTGVDNTTYVKDWSKSNGGFVRPDQQFSGEEIQGGGIKGTASKNADSWMTFLTTTPINGKTLTKDQAAGVVAGMMGESGKGLNPAAYNPDDGGSPSGGTAQWRGERLTKLKEQAKKEGKDWTDLGLQQRYLKQEWETSEKGAFNDLVQQKTARDALSSHVTKFERSKNQEADVQTRSVFIPGIMKGTQEASNDTRNPLSAPSVKETKSEADKGNQTGYDSRHARANFMQPGPEFGKPGENIEEVSTPGKHTFSINKASAPAFKGFISDLEAQGVPLGKVGGYNPRPGGIGGRGKMSQHAMGNAMDIGSQSARDVISPETRNWIETHPKEWRATLDKWGMISGGDWKNPDLGHVEWSGQKPWETNKQDTLSADASIAPPKVSDIKAADAKQPIPGKPGTKENASLMEQKPVVPGSQSSPDFFNTPTKPLGDVMASVNSNDAKWDKMFADKKAEAAAKLVPEKNSPVLADDLAPLQADIDNLKSAVSKSNIMTPASNTETPTAIQKNPPEVITPPREYRNSTIVKHEQRMKVQVPSETYGSDNANFGGPH